MHHTRQTAQPVNICNRDKFEKSPLLRIYLRARQTVPANSRDRINMAPFRTRASPSGLKGSVGMRTTVRGLRTPEVCGHYGKRRKIRFLPADLTACDLTAVHACATEPGKPNGLPTFATVTDSDNHPFRVYAPRPANHPTCQHLPS